MGGILLTHLQNLPCNAHEIAEIEIPAGSVKDSAQTEIGNTYIVNFWPVCLQEYIFSKKLKLCSAEKGKFFNLYNTSYPKVYLFYSERNT